MSVSEIKRLLDTMFMAKMNVFHWHVSDTQSFPFASARFPDFVKGAYAPDAIYTPANVQDIVSYAKDRAIIVVPEFDMPSHASSWSKGLPQIVTLCVMVSLREYFY